MAGREHLFALLCVGASFGSGCTASDLVANNCRINGQPCTDPMTGVAGNSGSESFDMLDLLLVVDNTTSMAATQAQLAQQLPPMIRLLTHGDVDGDGRLEFTPVTDVHFAVVSTDMGAPGIVGLPDCGEDTGRPLGDDGLFVNNPSDTLVLGQSCVMLPTFLTFEPGLGPAADEFLLHQSGCLGVLGTEGCGYGMPLESALKALWRQSEMSVQFLSGGGHGVDVQADFVRDNALLAIIVVTDDDDCSAMDVTHFTPSDQLSSTDPLATIDRNLRCVRASDHLHPVGRYENGFGLLKSGRLGRLFFGVIAGVPIDLANQLSATRIPMGRELAYRALLDDPRMQQVVDSQTAPGARDLTKSCGNANPPRRLVELARRFEAQATVGSICDDLSVPMTEMTRALARLIDPTTEL